MLVLLSAISVAHDEYNSLLEGVGNPILTGWSLLINDHSQLSLVKLTYNTGGESNRHKSDVQLKHPY